MIRGLLLLGCLACCLSCGKHETAGNSTETENAIAFQIRTPDGKAAAGVAYKIRPLWYLADTTQIPDTSIIVSYGITDADGWIRLENQIAGSYLIELVSDSLAGILQYTQATTVTEATEYKIALQPTGAVTGKVGLPDSVSYAWVQIYGLETMVRTDSTGAFFIAGLPAGELHFVAWSPAHSATLGQATIAVPIGDTLDIGLLPAPTVLSEAIETWKYVQTLSPSVLISDWMRPLQQNTVLALRLDSSNFDFSQALPDGHDFRILNAKGEYLDVERVRWDKTARRAVLRIRIRSSADTLDSWTLKWGNPKAVASAKPNVWEGLSDSLFLELNSVLVGDFENQSEMNSLPSPLIQTRWYMGKSDSAELSPYENATFRDALVPADSGRAGTAAHFTFHTDDLEWTLIGTTLGPGPRSLAILDSVEFWYRGDGKYTVSLEYVNGSVSRKAINSGMAKAQWTRIRVRPVDLFEPDSLGGNYGWDFVKDRITHLSFFSSKGSQFWIDDVRLYGISRDDLK